MLKNVCRVGLVGAATLAVSVCAQAQLLQGNLLLRQTAATNLGMVNQVFSDFPTFSTGMGSMVTTPVAWNISDIQIFQIGSTAAVNTWFGNVNQATLNVSRQTAGAPDASVDPTSSTNSGASIVYSGLVSVVLDEGTANALGANQSFRMTAATGAITQLQGLPAGNYVFSLAGNAPFGTLGQTFTGAANLTGTDDYVRNTGGGFALPSTTNWGTLFSDFSTSGAVQGTQWGIGINGAVVPEPASLAALGLGALALIRRRRSNRA